MEAFFGLICLLVLAVGTATTMISLHQFLGPKRSGKVHDSPFECGLEANTIIRGRFSVKFFLVALLFILFDIELIFLFPWSLVFRELGLFGLVEMTIFLAVVVVGLFYSVKRGALEWN